MILNEMCLRKEQNWGKLTVYGSLRLTVLRFSKGAIIFTDKMTQFSLADEVKGHLCAKKIVTKSIKQYLYGLNLSYSLTFAPTLYLLPCATWPVCGCFTFTWQFRGKLCGLLVSSCEVFMVRAVRHGLVHKICNFDSINSKKLLWSPFLLVSRSLPKIFHEIAITHIHSYRGKLGFRAFCPRNRKRIRHIAYRHMHTKCAQSCMTSGQCISARSRTHSPESFSDSNKFLTRAILHSFFAVCPWTEQFCVIISLIRTTDIPVCFSGRMVWKMCKPLEFYGRRFFCNNNLCGFFCTNDMVGKMRRRRPLLL